MRRLLTGLMIGAWLIAAQPGMAVGAAQAQEPTDWPLTIAQLRHEVQRRPGLAFLRQQLAVALNNYGVSLAEEGQWELAKEQFREALKIDPSDAQFSKNFAVVYLSEAHHAYQSRRTKEAREALAQAIALNPNLAEAYALLGEIEYDGQQLAKAKVAWQKAAALAPQLEHVRQRLERLAEELPVESKFERLSQAYFDLRYEEEAQVPEGFDLRDALLDARSSVGADFAYWPKYKIVVLIYTADSFRALRQETPDWVAGQYDGKIRVPLPDGQIDATRVRQILAHEYTHALVHELTRGRCPVWFNEGLAEYEGQKGGVPDFEPLAASAARNRLVPWDQLDLQFSSSLPIDQVALGYQEAHSIIQYLVERYGFWRIRRVLKAVADGGSLEAVLSREFHLKLERLEANWRAWLPRLTALAAP